VVTTDLKELIDVSTLACIRNTALHFGIASRHNLAGKVLSIDVDVAKDTLL